MDQSKSSNESGRSEQITLPSRSFTIEFFVGIFALVGVAAAGLLAVGLGDVRMFSSNRYEFIAEFDNISGLQAGASVEIAGVPVGEVARIALQDPSALVYMSINRDVKIFDEDIISIRTKGIIGDRFVKISRGGSLDQVPAGSIYKETQAVVDLEDVIGKIIHNLGGNDKEEKAK